MGPAADQSTSLIVEMREFDLQAPFGSRCTLAEDLQNQAGAIYDLALELLFQIALLDRRKRTIDNDQLSLVLLAGHGNILNLPLAEERCRAWLANGHDEGIGHFDANCQCEAFRLFEPGIGVLPAHSTQDRTYDEGARTARYLSRKIVLENCYASPGWVELTRAARYLNRTARSVFLL